MTEAGFPLTDPFAVMNAHRQRWHDQEVFLASQLLILRRLQAASAVAAAFCDLRATFPDVATLVYTMKDGAAALQSLMDGSGAVIPDAPSSRPAHGTARETAIEAALRAVSNMPRRDRLTYSAPGPDGCEKIDLEWLVRRTANTVTRRKPDPELDPMTQFERQVLVSAAHEGFDSYSARLMGEWDETDEELATVRQQQERLAAILGHSSS